MSKKTISLILCGIMLLAIFSSCQPAQQTATVNVKIIGYEDTVLYDGEVEAVGTIAEDGKPVVADILLALEILEEIDNLSLNNDYTSIEQIGDYKQQPDNQNTGAYFWNYSINGVSAADEDSGLTVPGIDVIEDGDEVIFTYEWTALEEETE